METEVAQSTRKRMRDDRRAFLAFWSSRVLYRHFHTPTRLGVEVAVCAITCILKRIDENVTMKVNPCEHQHPIQQMDRLLSYLVLF